MLVKAQRVLMPVTGVESWTVVDDHFAPVEAAERYLAFLSSIEPSPNTVRAYAHRLALWLEFLALSFRECGRVLPPPVDRCRASDNGVDQRCSRPQSRGTLDMRLTPFGGHRDRRVWA